CLRLWSRCDARNEATERRPRRGRTAPGRGRVWPTGRLYSAPNGQTQPTVDRPRAQILLDKPPDRLLPVGERTTRHRVTLAPGTYLSTADRSTPSAGNSPTGPERN